MLSASAVASAAVDVTEDPAKAVEASAATVATVAAEAVAAITAAAQVAAVVVASIVVVDAKVVKVVEEDKPHLNKKKSFNRNRTGLIEAITSNFKPQTSN